MADVALHHGLERSPMPAAARSDKKLRAAKFNRWERIGVELVRADLKHGGRFLVGPGVQARALAEEWLKLKDAQKRHSEKAAPFVRVMGGTTRRALRGAWSSLDRRRQEWWSRHGRRLSAQLGGIARHGGRVRDAIAAHARKLLAAAARSGSGS
jgi:hypothetical protein